MFFYYIFSVLYQPFQINDIINSALAIVDLNKEGPTLYLQQYIDYYYLLDGTDIEMIKIFLESEPILRDISIRIHEYDYIRRKIYSFRNTVRI
jgi:hypothetical protein